MLDLFSQEQEVETIPIPNGRLKFVHALYSEEQSQYFYQNLLEQTLWREEQIEVWGKLYQQPRLCAWYGDQGSDYSYSGIHLVANAWTATLSELKHKVESISGSSYNSVLINLYRDQHDSVGWHSDDEPELGTQATIASLSFGERRTFKLRHKFDKTLKPISHCSTFWLPANYGRGYATLLGTRDT